VVVVHSVPRMAFHLFAELPDDLQRVVACFAVRAPADVAALRAVARRGAVLTNTSPLALHFTGRRLVFTRFLSATKARVNQSA